MYTGRPQDLVIQCGELTVLPLAASGVRMPAGVEATMAVANEVPGSLSWSANTWDLLAWHVLCRAPPITDARNSLRLSNCISLQKFVGFIGSTGFHRDL